MSRARPRWAHEPDRDPVAEACAFQNPHWCSAANVAAGIVTLCPPGRSDMSWRLVYAGQYGWPGATGAPSRVNAPHQTIIWWDSTSWAGVSWSYSEVPLPKLGHR